MSCALTEPMGSTSFREDAPRPPVPGEEGEEEAPRHELKSKPVRTSSRAPRRDDDGLGEPEGRATPDSPLARWTKSLRSLLADRDGAHLFRTFLERERCEDALDFWFACNGFRQMDLQDAKTRRAARAIYKRYVETRGVVAEHLRAPTRACIRDGVKKQGIELRMFDQAQTEIEARLEESAYRAFLTSDIYLEYARSGGENATCAGHAHVHTHTGLELVCGYLPPLIEDKEWSCGELKAKALATVVGLSAETLRATVTLRTTNCRTQRRADPASPYFVNSGHVVAPVSSANDSEVSSDATTDDSMSMTDSSVDGIPPYKLGTKKQLQREMHRSIKINGQVSLPHFPRTQRLPREMAPVKPSVFAAELIARLEKLKHEQDTLSSLERRLQQIQEEEERDESELPGTVASQQPPPALSLFSTGLCDEDPQAILDDHLSRVLKTPGCQSPGVPGYSPRSRSPDRPHQRGAVPNLLPSVHCSIPPQTVPQSSTKHIYHHYIHHHSAAPPKSKEQMEAEAAHRVAQCLGSDYRFQRGHGQADLQPGHTGTLSKRPSKVSDGMSACQSSEEGSGSPSLLADGVIRSHNVMQWIHENERQNRHKPHSSQILKKPHPSDPSTKTALWGGGAGVGARAHHPGHPFIQDPTMPPLSPPNTLTQLEEACRRLEEASKPIKQRHSVSSLQRERAYPSSFPSGSLPLISLALQPDEWKDLRRTNASALSGSELVVTYFFCGEEIPYRRLIKTHSLTLGHFKEQLRKKGNYRYYFKKASDEFECGAVFEEILEDGTVLPMYEGKILGKVERMD